MNTGPLTRTQIEERFYQYLKTTLERFSSEHPKVVFNGLVLDLRPFDPGVGINLNCQDEYLDHEAAFSEERRYREPDLWCYELADQDVLTKEEYDEAFDWLMDFLNVLQDPKESKPMNGEAFEAFIESACLALARIETELVHAPGFAKNTLCFAIVEDDDVDEALERYQAVKVNQLEPGWTAKLPKWRGFGGPG